MASIVVAGDTSGSITIAAPAEAGTNTLTLPATTAPIVAVSPGASGNILTSNGTSWTSTAPVASGIGIGQTWQNVTGSRSSGVTYTNSTGKPIQVFVTKSGNGGGATFVDGNQVGYWFANGNDFTVFACVVPNGSTYRVDGGIGQWSELR